MNRKRTSGFTLMELMIVITIIGGLAALSYSAYSGYIRDAKVKAAETTIMRLEAALKQYESDLGVYPPTPEDPTKNASVYAALTGDLDHDGIYDPVGGADIPRNHKAWRGPYLDKVQRSRMDDNGNFLDTWGTPYRYFENMREAPKCKVNKRSFLLYSLGPDRQATDASREDAIDFSKPFNKDNVKNWEDE